MCGRYALTLPHDAVAEAFGVEPLPELLHRGPRYNISPSQEIEAIRLQDGRREMARLRWGFIPHWYKTPDDGPLLINARAETVAEKRAFAKSIRERRCLIPASGFYEWSKAAGRGKEPWWVHPADGANPISFGGLWRDWEGADGLRLSTCAIVTVAANAELAPVHHRAPLVIAPEDRPLWLGERGKGAARLMRPAPDGYFALHRVGRAVNSPRADGPELLAPLEATRLL